MGTVLRQHSCLGMLPVGCSLWDAPSRDVPSGDNLRAQEGLGAAQCCYSKPLSWPNKTSVTTALSLGMGMQAGRSISQPPGAEGLDCLECLCLSWQGNCCWGMSGQPSLCPPAIMVGSGHGSLRDHGLPFSTLAAAKRMKFISCFRNDCMRTKWVLYLFLNNH